MLFFFFCVQRENIQLRNQHLLNDNKLNNKTENYVKSCYLASQPT